MIFISEIIRSYSCLYQLSLRLIVQSHVEKIAGLTSGNLYNEKMEPHMVVKLHRHWNREPDHP